MSSDCGFHIVVFTDTFFETNGVGSYYKTLLDWSRRTGAVHVSVVCPARDDLDIADVPEGVIPVQPRLQMPNPVYKMLTLGYYPQGALRRIVRDIGDPKVIHIATSGAVGVAGAMLARGMNLVAVGCYHTDLQRYGRLYGRSLFGRPGEWLGGLVTQWCDRLAYGSCDAFCAPSPSAADTVRTFYKGDVEVVPNPIDVEWFKPAPAREGPFREKYGRDGTVLAAVIGRMAKEKNLDLICELLRDDERIRLVFVGDGPYAATLRQRWGVDVTGFLHGRELLEAFQQSDLFVQLSTTETFGLSLVEALASGLPAVVLRSQGFAESIPRNHGVKVLEREQLHTLGDECLALVRNEERHRENARLARELALPFGTDAVLPRFVDFHRHHLR